MGPCRGYTADCSDLQAQFADVQGPYMYSDGPGLAPTQHMYIDSWVCHAFPDDAYTTDQFFVGLISVAVALPIDLFLVRAFEIANEGEMPGNWVTLPSGRWRMLLGKDMHNGWALADQRHPVSDFAMHLILVGDDWWDMLKFAVLLALDRLWQLLRRARSAPSFEPARPGDGGSPRSATGSPLSGGGFTPTRSSSRASSAGRSAAAARADALKKRLYASAGLFGVYLCWTIMSWCVAEALLDFSLLCHITSSSRDRFTPAYARFIFTYGMLIYRQLGDKAQQEFAKVRPALHIPLLSLSRVT